MFGLRSFALYWEMGLGKTKAIIDEFCGLRMKEKCDCVIVISDKGSYMNWANNELPKHLPTNIKCNVVAWTGSLTQKYQQQVSDAIHRREQVLPVFLFNTESFSGSKTLDIVLDIISRVCDCYVALDEATSIKNPQAQRTKNLIKVGANPLMKYSRIMTGTPITQSPLDVFSQYAFMGKGLLGYKDYWAFRARYAIIVTEYAGVRSYQKIVGFQNQDELTARMEVHCSRLTKKECLDLPEKIYITHYVEMTPQQIKAYDEVKKELITQLDEGTVTAPLAIVGLTKLRQICTGCVITDEGDTKQIPSDRIPVLLRLLDETSGKVIIWCEYQADVEMIMDSLPKGSAVSYYGETSDEDRAHALEAFVHDPEVRYFVGTPSTGGKSLTLIVATTVVYYSFGFNLEHYLQSQDRAHRIGQTSAVTYVHLVCRDRVDEKVLERLRAKEDLSRSVLDNLKRII